MVLENTHAMGPVFSTGEFFSVKYFSSEVVRFADPTQVLRGIECIQQQLLVDGLSASYQHLLRITLANAYNRLNDFTNSLEQLNQLPVVEGVTLVQCKLDEFSTLIHTYRLQHVRTKQNNSQTTDQDFLGEARDKASEALAYAETIFSDEADKSDAIRFSLAKLYFQVGCLYREVNEQSSDFVYQLLQAQNLLKAYELFQELVRTSKQGSVPEVLQYLSSFDMLRKRVYTVPENADGDQLPQHIIIDVQVDQRIAEILSMTVSTGDGEIYKRRAKAKELREQAEIEKRKVADLGDLLQTIVPDRYLLQAVLTQALVELDAGNGEGFNTFIQEVYGVCDQYSLIDFNSQTERMKGYLLEVQGMQLVALSHVFDQKLFQSRVFPPEEKPSESLIAEVNQERLKAEGIYGQLKKNLIAIPNGEIYLVTYYMKSAWFFLENLRSKVNPSPGDIIWNSNAISDFLCKAVKALDSLTSNQVGKLVLELQVLGQLLLFEQYELEFPQMDIVLPYTQLEIHERIATLQVMIRAISMGMLLA